MFHTGDLNSGINKALAESKLVACFVTNGNEESRLWEDDFLQDSELSSRLQERSVLLRLEFGSEEANYLAAIFPIPKPPTLVAIWSGELKEYLAAGTAKQEFLVRLGKALESSAHGRRNVENDRPTSANMTSYLQTSEQRRTEIQNQQSSGHPSTSDSDDGSTIPFQSTSNNTPSSSSPPIDPRDNPPEDTKSHVEDQPKQPSQAADTANYAAIQRKRHQEAREERARILALVESDKVRRRKDAERKANRNNQLTEQSSAFDGTISSVPASAPKAQDCALQIRLFDGTSIRSKFPNTSTLNGDVRKWIDDHQQDDVPYIFKHVCTPLPNKILSMTDESRDLTALGLFPSATLIIVPVQAYASAYEVTEPRGIWSRGVSAGYGLGTWGINRVLTSIGDIVGGQAVALGIDDRTEASAPAGGSRPSNLRTLRDQDDNDAHHELYNGNTLNFEPRKDDHDAED